MARLIAIDLDHLNSVQMDALYAILQDVADADMDANYYISYADNEVRVCDEIAEAKLSNNGEQLSIPEWWKRTW